MTVEPKSIDDVKALVSKGVSRPTLYQVIVNLPQQVAGLNRNLNDNLEILTTRASVPSTAVNTIAVNGHEAMGVTREQPTVVTFNSPFTIQVMADRDYTAYKAIKRWLDQVAINANPNERRFGVNGQSQRINYYNTFATSIELKKLEFQGGRGSREANSYAEPFRVIFNNCFPVRLGEIALAADATDSAVEFQVDFAYETYSFQYDD